ncbi:MAG: hypothetical protein ACEQSC_00390 [Candidatus Nanopelagicaceae bacterium]
MVAPDKEHLRPYNVNSDLFDSLGHLVGGMLEVNDPRINPPFKGWSTNIPPTQTNNVTEHEIRISGDSQ